MPRTLALAVLFIFASAAFGQAEADLQKLLDRKILGGGETLADLQRFLGPRIPRVPQIKDAALWEKYADQLRRDVLDKVVFRGEAAAWRDAKTEVVWLGAIEGGPGYRLKKVRFEALPGLWVPALLYEPVDLKGKVPAHLCVMGHEGAGKDIAYQQTRCINLAKRGMLALNVEWLGFGQLAGTSYVHYRMNQLDLCGTSGLAPFYLCLKRGLDVLLSHAHADPERVSVSGLSGGGWQTIFFSALDTRVRLANPVAGYSSFRTRLRHFKDLGDSEQTPCDLATVADYDHLTALLAPRPALLTYNAKDECCFEAGYALPPLLEAAGPIYGLLGKKNALRSHVNHVPGTHNYDKENREAFYKIVGDFFLADDKGYSAQEIPSDKEVKKRQELTVPLPAKNHDFNSLARALAEKLPAAADLPRDKEKAKDWQDKGRADLRKLVRARDYAVKPASAGTEKVGDVNVEFWRLKLGDDWSVPVVELTGRRVQGTALVIHDGGRTKAAARIKGLLAENYRVLVVDPFYFGEARLPERDFLLALFVSTVGERPLGIQASQIAAAARWAQAERKNGPVTIFAYGPRSSLIALVAAALEPSAVGRVELANSLASLKEVIEQNRSVQEMPELFCFGLLKEFDVKQLAALAAPRPVSFTSSSPRLRQELAGLSYWYRLLGSDFDPLR
jgi:hypothetical protein